MKGMPETPEAGVMKAWWRFLLVMCVLAVPAGAAVAAEPAVVEAGTVRSEVVGSALWVPGTVVSREDARVAAEVPGMLAEVTEVGTRVEKGETLARLNDRELRLQLALDTAEMERRKARLEYLGRQVDRIAQLARTNTSAEAELDQLRAERDMLAQELAAAVTARERTLYDIERTRIVAPFPGVVVERLANPGEYTARGMAVVRLVNTDSLEIRAQAPIDSLRGVRPGDVLHVKSGADAVETHVRSVVPVGDQISRMLELRLALQGGNWVVGEPVRVAISQGRPVAALTVPRDALVLREGATYLYRITQENIAERVDVVTGEGIGDRVVVRGDLRDGERVITRGAERLHPGRPVRIL